jgi:hypothetical protein
VPGEPDVPVVLGDEVLVDGAPAETPELERLAEYLRDAGRDDTDEPAVERPAGFDFPAVIEAVRVVSGVRDAALRTNEAGVPTLRLELAEDADPGQVSREVARLLKEQMGLSAEPNPPALDEPEQAARALPVPSSREPRRESHREAHREAHRRPVPSARVTDEAEVGADQTPAWEPLSEVPFGPAADAPPTAAPGLIGAPAARTPERPAMDPHRLADLPRVGEAPRPADRVRFGSVPPRGESRSRPRDARFGRGPWRPAVEPELGLDAWLEAGGGMRREQPPPEPAVLPVPPPRERSIAPDHSAEPTPEPESAGKPAASVEPEPVFAAGPAAGLRPVGPAGPGLAEPAGPGRAEPAGPGVAESAAAPQAAAPPALHPVLPVSRVRIEQVEVSTHGLDAFVQVRLSGDGAPAAGSAVGPAVDGYVLRLCASAAAAALDELLVDAESGQPRGRCYVEHAAVVPFGSCEVAVVVMLLVCEGWVEQLAGSALVAGDARQAIVRATLAAANRRLEALLP